MEAAVAGEVAVEQQDLGQHAIGLGTEAAERRPVIMPVEVMEGFVDEFSAQTAAGAGGGGQRRGVEGGAKEFPPLPPGVEIVQGQLPGAGPDAHLLAEAAPARCGIAGERLLGVGAVEAVESEEDLAVDPRAEVEALAAGSGMEPAADLQIGRGGPPVDGLVDVEGEGGRGGHRVRREYPAALRAVKLVPLRAARFRFRRRPEAPPEISGAE